ncbi:sterol desaturase family protein [Jatrophihabitans sp. DSM 45814]
MVDTDAPAELRAAAVRSVYLPSLALAALTAWLAWYGWSALSAYDSIAVIRAGQLRNAGPIVLGFVTVVLAIEHLRPAQRRAFRARGPQLDFGYFVAYALVVMPLVTLLGAGFATLLQRHAEWLVLPRLSLMPRAGMIVIGLLAIDGTDWLVHLINHKINPFWRMHAVHHSQEELGVLTTFRAHPLVHLSFVLSVVPGFVLTSNAATPTTLTTVYACLGTLPHANVDWSYGLAGRILVSPAYHRIHHRACGRLDINLGVVFTIWDSLTGRAIYPEGDRLISETGLAGRPVPIEQNDGKRGLTRTFVRQWAEPFTQPSLRSGAEDA